MRRASDECAHSACSEERGPRARERRVRRKSRVRCSRLSSVLMLRVVDLLGAEAQVVQSYADDAAQHGQISDPLRGSFPEAHHPGNVRIFGQSAISLGIRSIVEHINDARSAHSGGIIDARFFKSEILAKLSCASLRQVLHVVLAAKVEAAGGAGLDARRFQSLAYAIHAQRALEHFLGRRVELGNIERASADAISATNARSEEHTSE